MARTRPGTDREFRFTETEEPDDTDEDDDGDDGPADGTPPTSLADLTTEADPQQFDRTFTAGGAPLRIQGAFDPVAGNKQVIPRVAYVLNYNLVYNESRDRWEPQKKGSGGAGQPAVAKSSPSTAQTIGSNSSIQVRLDAALADDRGAVNTASNEIQVSEAGGYVLVGSVGFQNVTAAGVVGTAVRVNGSLAAITEQETEGSTDTDAKNRLTTTTVSRLEAGDAVTLRAACSDGATGDTVPADGQTHLATVQVCR